MNCSRWFPIVATAFVLGGLACSNDSKITSTAPPTSTPHRIAGPPDGWFTSAGTGFTVGLDQGEKHGGAAALYVTGEGVTGSSFTAVSQSLRADTYRGKRLRWSAWVKQENLVGADIGLWMRVDGPVGILQFDNMSSRSLSGSADWRQVSVVLDVPASAIGVVVGVLSDGNGTLLVDDAKLESVGTDVPTTAIITNQQNGSDSATVAQSYARNPSAPVNLDFEGVAGFGSDVVSWIAKNSVTLGTTEPTASLSDLAPLTQIVGNVHVVGMGEGTHGTHEFFQMKHRLLEHLVTQMGFTTFAIEATTPQSEDINQYVLTGKGDLHALLSHLYFWTWNTQEVFDMIQWMRQWNTTAAPERRVQFLGFDMQHPGAALDSVASFISRVDASKSAAVSTAFGCIAPYRDVKGAFPIDLSQYSGLPAAIKASCASSLQSVYDLLAAGEARYVAASSPSEFQHALHAARLVQQFEAMASPTSPAVSAASRDRSMAENVEWIRGQLGEDAKIALWAHNLHINAVPGTMGGYLRTAFGADYLPIGFAFGSGTFNAVATSGSLRSWQTTLIPNGSLESAFDATGKPALLLDMRLIPNGGAAAALLRGPIPMRNIGSGFSLGSDASVFRNALFPDDFDVMIYLQATQASMLLPFVQ